MLGLGSSRIDDPQLKARRELFRCCSGLTSGEHRGLDMSIFPASGRAGSTLHEGQLTIRNRIYEATTTEDYFLVLTTGPNCMCRVPLVLRRHKIT